MNRLLALGIGLAVAAASASQACAAVYTFTIGTGTAGSFTTGAASPTDSGYFLLTSLGFSTVSGTDSVNSKPVFFTNQTNPFFEPDAAYDPTTMGFINHAYGNTYYDSGSIYTQDINLFTGLGANRQYGGYLKSNGDQFLVTGSLEVSPGVPEASTWAMMLLGFGGIGMLARRRAFKGLAAPLMPV